MPELESALRALGAQIEFPATPDLASGLRGRLERPRSRRRPLIIALAALVVVVGAILAVPPARTAVLDWLGLPETRVGHAPLGHAPQGEAPAQRVPGPGVHREARRRGHGRRARQRRHRPRGVAPGHARHHLQGPERRHPRQRLAARGEHAPLAARRPRPAPGRRPLEGRSAANRPAHPLNLVLQPGKAFVKSEIPLYREMRFRRLTEQ